MGRLPKLHSVVSSKHDRALISRYPSHSSNTQIHGVIVRAPSEPYLVRSHRSKLPSFQLAGATVPRVFGSSSQSVRVECAARSPLHQQRQDDCLKLPAWHGQRSAARRTGRSGGTQAAFNCIEIAPCQASHLAYPLVIGSAEGSSGRQDVHSLS